MASVLLVDDEPLMRRTISHWLAHRGFEVECESNGAEALELLRKVRFDVLIADVDMPRMTGIGLLRTVREEMPELPVVLISGSAQLGARAEARASGAFDFLEKPLDLRALEEVVTNAVQHANLILVRSLRAYAGG